MEVLFIIKILKASLFNIFKNLIKLFLVNNFLLQSNYFKENSALNGGVICFGNILPKQDFIFSNIFIKNNALYGPNYASYPNRIIFPEQKSFKVISLNSYPGVQMENFSLSLIDHFGQLIETDSEL